MANTRGVFTLQDVRYAQEDDVWVSPEQSFASDLTAPPNIGYYGGGGVSPGRTSAINKIDYSTETRSTIPSTLNQTMSAVGGVGSINNGYFVGGFIGSDSSITEKFSYSSETSGRVPALNTSTVRYYVAAAGNKEFAYCNAGAPGYQTRVDKLIYSVDVMADSPASYLPTNISNLGAVGSGTAAYFGGGATAAPTVTNAISKTVFATDTNATIPGTLSLGRSANKGTGNEDQGYWFGGTINGADKSTTDKITYSNETVTAVPGAFLTTVRYNTGAAGNQSTGYNLGGSPGYRTDCDKTVYSTDTTSAVPGARLSVPTGAMGTFSPRENGLTPSVGYVASTQNLKANPTANIGYTFQGSVPGNVGTSYLHKLDYSTDALGVVPSGNLTASKYHNKTRTSPTAAYTSGGIPGTPVSTTNKTTYSTETSAAVPSANTTVPVWGMAASSNTKDGYNYGGLGPGPAVTTVDKINFAGDTLSRIPGANLPQEGRLFQATGNPSKAYLGGGGPGSGTISSFDRIFYSNETTNRVPSANFNNQRRSMTAAGNDQFGYYSANAAGPQSTTSKLSYATDLVSDVPSAALSAARAYGGGTGNLSNGYNFSGYISPTRYTLTERINYTTDTIVQIPSANFPVPIYAMAGASVKDNDYPQKRPETPTLQVSYTQITTPFTGYFGGGGGPGGKTSNYYKLLFASETGSFLPSTHMSTARSTDLGGYSDSTDGWTMGGYAGSPTFAAQSNTDRLTYATDTSVAVPGANLPGGGRYGGRQGCSTTAGYFVAGFGGGAFSSTLKMPFSTESQAIAPGAALSSARYYFCGGGGTDKGYFGGGYENSPGTPVTKFDKLVYSTDTMTASPASNLKIENTRSNSKGCGDSRSLYFAGAQSPATGLLDFGYKIPYNTDTSMLISGFLVAPRDSAVSTGHELEGYYMGGQIPSPYVQLTTVDKINYATEVCSLVPTASLPEHRGGGSNLGCRNMAASGGGTSNTL